jgi:hypothetical protein
MNHEKSRGGPHIPEVSFLQPTLDNSCRCFAIVRHKFTADDGSADGFGSVDDFLDSGDAESYIHRRDTGEVKSFQSHLRSWFSD